MDKPLSTWYCDVCGEKIENVKKGYVIWKHNNNRQYHSYKIIHQSECDLKDHISSMALVDLIGNNGLTKLLSHVSDGPIIKNINGTSFRRAESLDEFTELLRRIHTPYYEQARRYFHQEKLIEDFYDSNSIHVYVPDTLKWICKTYETKT